MIKCESSVIDGVTHVRFSGEIDEEFDLHDQFRGLSGPVHLNLRGITYVDSSGLREWIRAIGGVPPEARIEFHELSVRFVYQLNMTLNARGKGRVVSFLAPFFCVRCDKRRDVLLVIDAHPQHLGRPDAISVPPQRCPECSNPLLFDELPQEYFLFLKMQMKEQTS